MPLRFAISCSASTVWSGRSASYSWPFISKMIFTRCYLLPTRRRGRPKVFDSRGVTVDPTLPVRVLHLTFGTQGEDPSGLEPSCQRTHRPDHPLAAKCGGWTGRTRPPQVFLL